MGDVLIPGYQIPTPSGLVDPMSNASVLNGTTPVAAIGYIVVDHTMCSGPLTVNATVSGAKNFEGARCSTVLEGGALLACWCQCQCHHALHALLGLGCSVLARHQQLVAVWTAFRLALVTSKQATRACPPCHLHFQLHMQQAAVQRTANSASGAGVLAPVLKVEPTEVTTTLGQVAKIAVSLAGKTMDDAYTGLITLNYTSSEC